MIVHSHARVVRVCTVGIKKNYNEEPPCDNARIAKRVAAVAIQFWSKRLRYANTHGGSIALQAVLNALKSSDGTVVEAFQFKPGLGAFAKQTATTTTTSAMTTTMTTTTTVPMHQKRARVHVVAQVSRLVSFQSLRASEATEATEPLGTKLEAKLVTLTARVPFFAVKSNKIVLMRTNVSTLLV
jgi:hypothetical protein